MRAFDIHAPLPAAGVVLLLMNVVTIFPFWPGNVGLVQVAIASALVGYGVPYAVGVAYGFGLQAIEASVGIGVGLLSSRARDLSVAMLRVMPGADRAELPAKRRRGKTRAAASSAPLRASDFPSGAGGRDCSARRASSSTLPSAASSFARQNA